jgi:hypothetical protein
MARPARSQTLKEAAGWSITSMNWIERRAARKA